MNRVALMLALAAVVLVPQIAAAAADNFQDGMREKAVRGAIDAVTGLVELPVQISKGYEAETGGNWAIGSVLGLFRGVSHTLGRTTSGVLNVVGFWAANPESNDGIGLPLDADRAWDEGQQYSFLNDGPEPIGRKFGRGVVDLFTGIVELPAQITEGAQKDTDHRGREIGVGILEGIWYSASRIYGGAAELITFPLPNPAETDQVMYETKWSWEMFMDRP